MAQAPDNSINLSEVILDLDEITNIAHPCWEYIQPNPSIHELFDEYNQLFFDGILEFEVDIDWSSLENYNSGETVPAEKTKKGRRMTIVLNENILRNRMRHEIIETLIVRIIVQFNNLPCTKKLNESIFFIARNDSRILDQNE